MHIKKIEIQNIKGLDKFELSQPIFANRPNILVAPNGFGKSSFATAFSSLNSKRIDIKDDEIRNGDNSLSPLLAITTCEENEERFIATSTGNSISNKFDIFVVNCQLRPNAKAQRFGKIITAKASLNIAPTIIYKTIPRKVEFAYSYSRMKKDFGNNGKVLDDISKLLQNPFIIELIEKKVDFNHFKLKTFQTKLNSVVSSINSIISKNSEELKIKILST